MPVAPSKNHPEPKYNPIIPININVMAISKLLLVIGITSSFALVSFLEFLIRIKFV